MYILLTGTPPFNGRSDREILDRVKSGKYSLSKPQFRYVSQAGKDLLNKMLTYEPGQRPTAKECYDHPWFKKEHRLDKKKLDHETLKNFKHFQYRSKLQRALYHFLADNLSSSEEKKRLTETFKALDINGDGTLSKDEIMSGYSKTVGITNEELDKLLKECDVNHTGKINYTGKRIF